MRNRGVNPQLRITHGAMILLALEVGLSVVFLLSDLATRATIADWIGATPTSVWGEGKVWTLITSSVLEIRPLSLLLQALVLWMLLPTLERFWGTARFLRFALVTSVAATLGGTLAGLATGREVPIIGLDPFMHAGIVAFGMTYARQPVQFFGVLPLTARQLMYGVLALAGLFFVLNQAWEEGAATAAAVAMALWLTHRTHSPERWIDAWRKRRKRKGLTVVQGGRSRTPSQYLN